MSSQSQLFQPLQIRGLSLPNRLVISPMCQYSADDGLANDWHLAHLGKLAQGGAAVVFTEAAAVQRRGRITHGDLGIWTDAHAQALAGIARFVSSMGSVPAIQLAHAGARLPCSGPGMATDRLTTVIGLAATSPGQWLGLPLSLWARGGWCHLR